MELKIGVVTHYYPKISVAIVEITDEPLAIGDTIHIKGRTTDFQEPVTSMQIEHQQIQLAKKGDIIGLKVSQRCQEKDIVYKVIP